MSIAIDVILVIIFALFAIKFTKDGFIISLIKIGGKWLSFFLALVLNPFVTNRLHEGFFNRSITNGIENTLTNLVENNPNGYTLSQLFEELPEGFLGLLRYFNVSLPMLEAEYGSSTEATDAIIADIAGRIATPCSMTISRIIAYLICFLISLIFFWWLRKNVERIIKHSFFFHLDKMFGFITGTLLGLCAVLAIVAVTYTVFQLFIVYDSSSTIMSVYENSYVFKFINEIDMIKLFKGIFQR